MPYGMSTDDHDMIWVAQNGQPNVPASLVAFDPQGALGRIVVPQIAFVP